MVAKKKPGSGGNNKRRLAGKGPTPKAEDRTYHPAAKRKAAAASKPKSSARRPKGDREQNAPREYEVQDDVIVGRNPVLEALRAGIAVKRVMVACTRGNSHITGCPKYVTVQNPHFESVHQDLVEQRAAHTTMAHP